MVAPFNYTSANPVSAYDKAMKKREDFDYKGGDDYNRQSCRRKYQWSHIRFSHISLCSHLIIRIYHYN